MKNKEINKERLKPISLYPLKPEKALSLFMQIDTGEINATSKPCKICHIPKPFTEFTKDPQCKSGITNRCKACTKEYHKNYYRTMKGQRKGFNWKEINECCPTSAEEEFIDLFGNCNIWAKGKLVMKKGKILDEEWYQKKLNKLRKGRKG